ncbi:hypothetical protein JCGZ_13217 [Jatropha curcas]|uniref:Uncharacterized protein n=1 Tax=Jatropha curcas TaxID=180498 RepID=A0A067K879_JATCU|nr:hypothetical protein JCGZ_13217 [Jatropha curcas]
MIEVMNLDGIEGQNWQLEKISAFHGGQCGKKTASEGGGSGGGISQQEYLKRDQCVGLSNIYMFPP